jgi:hypothetical protein
MSLRGARRRSISFGDVSGPFLHPDDQDCLPLAMTRGGLSQPALLWRAIWKLWRETGSAVPDGEIAIREAARAADEMANVVRAMANSAAATKTAADAAASHARAVVALQLPVFRAFPQHPIPAARARDQRALRTAANGQIRTGAGKRPAPASRFALPNPASASKSKRNHR